MQSSVTEPLSFASDYLTGAHPKILERIVATNAEQHPGYGTDDHCAAAREKIKAACQCAHAAVHFFAGGTQTNLTVISALLRSYEGVLAADTAHISTHEAGAIELGGHKVLSLPHTAGLLTAAQIEAALTAFETDGNRAHMVKPGMVYLSHPTEYGTLYTREALADISAVCRAHGIPLYVDGARLAYALASPANDVTLPDLARLCDAFYIGGTKCGALFGEALVIASERLMPHFFTIMKQRGALMAKGRLLGVQFDALFTDGFYHTIGAPAIESAQRIKALLQAAGIPLYLDTPTNQIFMVLENAHYETLQSQVSLSFWEAYDDTHTVVRLATSWATTTEDVHRFAAILQGS